MYVGGDRVPILPAPESAERPPKRRRREAMQSGRSMDSGSQSQSFPNDRLYSVSVGGGRGGREEALNSINGMSMDVDDDWLHANVGRGGPLPGVGGNELNGDDAVATRYYCFAFPENGAGGDFRPGVDIEGERLATAVNFAKILRDPTSRGVLRMNKLPVMRLKLEEARRAPGMRLRRHEDVMELAYQWAHTRSLVSFLRGVQRRIGGGGRGGTCPFVHILWCSRLVCAVADPPPPPPAASVYIDCQALAELSPNPDGPRLIVPVPGNADASTSFAGSGRMADEAGGPVSVCDMRAKGKEVQEKEEKSQVCLCRVRSN